ncbi:hypothetical protein JCM10295v2_004608 [Rhodotorula toruloides]
MISSAHSIVGKANGKPTASAKAAVSSASSGLSSLCNQAAATSSAIDKIEPAIVASLTSELLRSATAASTGSSLSSDFSLLTSALAQPTHSNAIFANPSLSVLAEGVLRAASTSGKTSGGPSDVRATATGSTGSGGLQASGTSDAGRPWSLANSGPLAAMAVVGGVATGVFAIF